MNNNFKLTIRGILDNPTGKGSAYFYSRKEIKKGIQLEFISLLRENRRAFSAIPYIYENGDVLFHVRVPSSDYNTNKIAYDVLFLIEYENGKTLAQRNVKIFSNSPSFIFTYCYVCAKEGLLIPFAEIKLPLIALTTPPSVRNPIESFGFEKSTQIAAYYLMNGFCLTPGYLQKYGVKISAETEIEILSRVADPDELIEVYNHSKYLARKNHKKELSKTQLQEKSKQKTEFLRKQNKSKKEELKLIKKRILPKSKITAKKAKKSLIK